MKTDMQLQNDVIAELKWEPSIETAHVGVEARDGVITLSGRIASFAEKWDAERAVQRVAGVKAIVVALEVVLPGESKRNDSDIALAASHALSWQLFLPKDAVRIVVEKGFVTLSGAVAWHYQREAAFDAVRYLVGVNGVSNQVTIKPLVSFSSVKADIVNAIERQARGDAHNIAVDIQGADITLSGKVPNWFERAVAKKTAWSTPGVHAVIDNMTYA
ncbi:MAG: BON domain-containing protein [Pseudomonadota bacterium]|nr:BON domain-containing protein [Pseudomonadota bacterium]